MQMADVAGIFCKFGLLVRSDPLVGDLFPNAGIVVRETTY